MAESSLTFFSKKPLMCPVCETSFHREELRTGRGRLIAGPLTQELKRVYEPSQKYGEVFPLIYFCTTCPNCYYSAFPDDFLSVDEGMREKLEADLDRRQNTIRSIFDHLDFSEPRGLFEGCASYYFAMMCYDFFPPDVAPTFKQGLAAIRAAWLCTDLHRKQMSENWDYLARLFYRKARFFYAMAVERETSGNESLIAARHLGPDLDKNYGYDGVLYLSGLLEYKYGPTGNAEKRVEALNRSKRVIARIFGMGRASKNKPAAILDNARDVYDQITKELGQENPDPEQDAKS